MSKGPGKIQRAILDLLSGRASGPVYNGGGNTTPELTDNLQALGILPEGKMRRKTAAFRVSRACGALYYRGLIEVEWVWDEDHRVNCWSWSMKKEGGGTAGMKGEKL